MSMKNGFSGRIPRRLPKIAPAQRRQGGSGACERSGRALARTPHECCPIARTRELARTLRQVLARTCRLAVQSAAAKRGARAPAGRSHALRTSACDPPPSGGGGCGTKGAPAEGSHSLRGPFPRSLALCSFALFPPPLRQSARTRSFPRSPALCPLAALLVGDRRDP